MLISAQRVGVGTYQESVVLVEITAVKDQEKLCAVAFCCRLQRVRDARREVPEVTRPLNCIVSSVGR